MVRASSSKVQMFSEGDIGVLPPLGVYDPLGLIDVLAIEAGIRIPIDDCTAAPAGLIDSLVSVPTAGWLQIMLTMGMIEIGAFPLAKAQTGGYASNADNENDDGEVGDIANIPWVRYDDPETKTFKLNAERQNGR